MRLTALGAWLTRVWPAKSIRGLPGGGRYRHLLEAFC
jgi:hypothetical protein